MLTKRPDLYDWMPQVDEIFYMYQGEDNESGDVIAQYDTKVGTLQDISTLPRYYIKKSHYKLRMAEIVHHMNYFTRFYDLDKETYFAMMITKYNIDTNLDMPQMDVINMIMENIITPSFIRKCKMMSRDLYKLNIDSDPIGKYNNTPKITNGQAYQIVATSFCFRILTPILLHFTNVNKNFNPKIKTEYLKWFNLVFNKTIKRFEENDIPFYIPLCKFVIFRGDKLFKNNQIAFHQKMMIRGDTPELYNETVIREVVCVKTLYKLDHRKSCVSFIDGVIHRFSINYLKENYSSKPFEIDSEETSKDSDDSFSHAEAIEMATYKRDESSATIADVNSDHVMVQLRAWYSSFDISDEEYNFYYSNFYPNDISSWLFENFYADKFNDPYAVINLNRTDTVYLMICLKKILQRYKMYHLAQLVTAKVYGRMKENRIRSVRFLERVTNTDTYQNIISDKYANLMELGLKEDPVLRTLTKIINSTYTLVDIHDEINGYNLEHIEQEAVANEYILFLSII